MKYIKYLVLLLVAAFVFPTAVFAEGEEVISADNRVKVYFFRGEGCPHCADAETWFDSIQESYGSKFTNVDYETWYNEDNAKLMQEVAKVRGETADGVPYIVIGDKSWSGFAEGTMTDEILAQIDSLYSTDVSERYDVMAYVDGTAKTEEKKGNDVLALIVVLIVVGGICFGIYKARNTVSE